MIISFQHESLSSLRAGGKKRLGVGLPLVFLVEALNITRGFDLVHKRIIDYAFDPNVGNFRRDLRHQLLQSLHSFNAGVWRSLIRIDYRMIRLLRIG